MTGNGKHTTKQKMVINGDDWGMVSDCVNHITKQRVSILGVQL
jgi:hypothetical protein